MRLALGCALGAALMLTACGSSTTAPAESAATAVDAGAVASADACPEGPPARGPLADVGFDFNGVVGTIVNQTGAGFWVSNDRSRKKIEEARTPCFLENGKGTVFASGKTALLYVSATATDRSGTRIEIRDKGIGYPTAAVSGFRKSTQAIDCGTTGEVSFKENDSRILESMSVTGYSGQVRVARLVDDKDAVRTWSGYDNWSVDDWARIDLTVTIVGSCS